MSDILGPPPNVQGDHSTPHDLDAARVRPVCTSKAAVRQRRRQTKFTGQQVSVLNTSFSLKKYPDSREFQALASLLGLTLPQVRLWLQNHRYTYKKKHINEAAKAYE